MKCSCGNRDFVYLFDGIFMCDKCFKEIEVKDFKLVTKKGMAYLNNREEIKDEPKSKND